MQKANVAVESVAEKNGDGALAEYIRGQLGLVAQLERAMILERVSEGKRKRKQLGRHVHGSIPFGYVSAGEGKLEKHEQHAGTVQRIFHEARDGSSAGRIARELNRDGIPSARGGQWSPQAVRVMLRNPIYAGERYGVKRAQPAIVSRQTWNAAQATLDRFNKRPNRA